MNRWVAPEIDSSGAKENHHRLKSTFKRRRYASSLEDILNYRLRNLYGKQCPTNIYFEMTETIFFESTLPLSHAFSYQKEHTVFQPSQLFAFRELPRHARGSIFFFGNVFRRPLYNESTVQLLPPHSSGGFGLAHPIYKKLSQNCS